MNHRNARLLCFLGLAVFILFIGLAPMAHGQSATGTVVGRVLDPQGASVPDAAVTLKSDSTGAERATTADANGEYTFPFVLSGRYKLTVQAKGFSAIVLPVEVTVGASVRVDVNMSLGQVAETLVVEGEAGVAVQTENAQLGATFSPSMVASLPSIGQNPYDFVNLAPGAALASDGRGIGVTVNGQRTASGNYVLDGSENNATFFAGPGQDIPLDAVEEYRVQTNNFTADTGRNSGFNANVVTRRGSNHFHGDGYWLNRNSEFAANTFTNDSNGSPKSHFNRNQFGGTVAGPVFRDKIFFSASIEPIRVRSAGVNKFLVPNTSLLAVSSPATQAIFNLFPVIGTRTSDAPLSRTVIPCPTLPCDTNPADAVTIPDALVNVSSVVPADVGAGTPQNTYIALGRLDWNINSKTTMYYRYAIEDENIFGGGLPYSPALFQGEIDRLQNHIAALTRAWSPHFITETRVGYSRLRGPINPLVPAGNFFSFSTQGDLSGVSLPSGSSVFGGPQNTYSFAHSVSWIRGKHEFKFGGTYVHMRDNKAFGAYQAPETIFRNFGGNSASQNFVDGLVRYTIAIDPKGALPGQVVNPPFGPPSFIRHFRYNEPAFFFQDTFKITPRLTITPGIRWEYFGVLHSPDNEKQLDANFYLGAGSSIQEQITNGRYARTINAPGAFRNHFYLPQYNNYAPRLGMAYDIFGNGKTVFRSGAGIFYDRNFGNALFNAIQNPPNYGTIRFARVDLNSCNAIANLYCVFGNSPGRLRASSARFLSPTLRTSYSATWNATLEREMWHYYVLSASYVGGSGNRLYSLNNTNRVGSCAFWSAIDPRCADPNPDENGALPNGRLNRGATSINERGNHGHSTYHGLQLNVDSKPDPKTGLQFGVHYTWSHSIDNASSFFYDDPLSATGFGFLDPFSTQFDKGDSDFDTRHRISSYFIWEVPFGKAKSNWFQKYVESGWEISGRVQAQKGFALTLLDSSTQAGDFSVENPRPLVNGALPKQTLVPDSLTTNQWLWIPLGSCSDAACSTFNSVFTDSPSVNGPFTGIIPRSTFRRPGLWFQDVAFGKRLPLHREGMSLLLRAEFYNLFNHSNLYIPGGCNDFSSTCFGDANKNSIPGIVVNRSDNRQMVLGLRLNF